MEPRIWLIAGPTASGKSALALRLAREIGGEIVGADSMQLYADLRILTARPSAEEEAQAPHHLVGTADGAQAWSTGRWLRAALEVLEGCAARGRPAVVVGGTGLYFRALTEGMAEAPSIPAGVRARVGAIWDAEGEGAVRERLRAGDPRSEARIMPGDRQRLLRALEVLIGSGKALSDWHEATAPAIPLGAWRAVAIEPPRHVLYDRCDARLAAMVEAGALDEVRSLLARGVSPDLPVMKAVGVREFGAHLAGELSLDDALALAARETRRYAKRQLTWLRNQTPDWPRITAVDAQDQWRQLPPP